MTELQLDMEHFTAIFNTNTYFEENSLYSTHIMDNTRETYHCRQLKFYLICEDLIIKYSDIDITHLHFGILSSVPALGTT